MRSSTPDSKTGIALFYLRLSFFIMRYSRFYLLIIGLVFAAFAVVFDTFPRSTFSPLEKRDLATFPSFTVDRLLSGAFTKDISTWFSDSEPYRDHFMQMSMERNMHSPSIAVKKM